MSGCRQAVARGVLQLLAPTAPAVAAAAIAVAAAAIAVDAAAPRTAASAVRYSASVSAAICAAAAAAVAAVAAAAVAAVAAVAASAVAAAPRTPAVAAAAESTTSKAPAVPAAGATSVLLPRLQRPVLQLHGRLPINVDPLRHAQLHRRARHGRVVGWLELRRQLRRGARAVQRYHRARTVPAAPARAGLSRDAAVLRGHRVRRRRHWQ